MRTLNSRQIRSVVAVVGSAVLGLVSSYAVAQASGTAAAPATAAGASASSLSTIFSNLSSTYPPLFILMYSGFYLAGLFSVCWGAMHLAKSAKDEQRGGVHPMVAALIAILIGSVFCYMPTMLQSIAITTWGAGVSGPAGLVDYKTPTAANGNTFVSLRTFLQLVGVYTFGRGWWSLREVGVHGSSQNHTFYGGVVRIFAGIALVHIIDFLQTLSLTVGIPVLQTWITNMGGTG